MKVLPVVKAKNFLHLEYLVLSPHWGQDNIADILQTYFQINFLVSQMWYFDSNSLKFIPMGLRNNDPDSV